MQTLCSTIRPTLINACACSDYKAEERGLPDVQLKGYLRCIWIQYDINLALHNFSALLLDCCCNFLFGGNESKLNIAYYIVLSSPFHFPVGGESLPFPL